MARDFIKLVDRLKKDKIGFCLSPNQWQKLSIPVTLTWENVPFCRRKASAVPSVRGVYAFIITTRKKGFPPNGYIAYVGEAGQDSQETLRSRFVSYFSEMKSASRPVHYVLTKYKTHLQFHYSEVPDQRRNIRHIETSLCDALIPPYNVQDFSIDLRKGKKCL